MTLPSPIESGCVMATYNLNCSIVERGPALLPLSSPPLGTAVQPTWDNRYPDSAPLENNNALPANLAPRPMWALNKNLSIMVTPQKQLTITIEDEGAEEAHSWRPGTADSLRSGLFHPSSECGPECLAPKLLLWRSESEPVHMYEAAMNYPTTDVQKHLQSQRTQLNFLKYEVINAKQNLHEAQASVSKLTSELEKKLLFQNTKDLQNLKDENAELRLECQCLCMEVDFYLKGKAPLGEIDEKYYKGNVSGNFKTDTKEEVVPQIKNNQQHSSSEEQEEDNKWECSKCTFVNHPAIASCEMCNLAKGERFPFYHSPSCFCQPQKEKNLS